MSSALCTRVVGDEFRSSCGVRGHNRRNVRVMFLVGRLLDNHKDITGAAVCQVHTRHGCIAGGEGDTIPFSLARACARAIIIIIIDIS